VSNYFVARTGVDGNHKVCMIDLTPTGKTSIDTSFRDENDGTPCVNFDRTNWPHGRNGNAKPHSELFVVPDDSVH
jgi:cellulose biosynthesis protein BcsQ